tara:strand:- start:1861 stop:2328 length:468 start_codon:yes stop_codon:yes gene_type:complete
MNVIYLKEVIDKFCEQQHVSRSVLFSKDRSRVLVDKRMVLAFFLKHKTELRWYQIGEIMNRTHASMIHYVNNVEQLMSVYPHIKKMVVETNKLFTDYKFLLKEKETNMYAKLLTDNLKLKEKIENNHKLIKELIKLEKNGTENKKQKNQHRRTEV